VRSRKRFAFVVLHDTVKDSMRCARQDEITRHRADLAPVLEHAVVLVLLRCDAHVEWALAGIFDLD
jgi:hypothetical protein